MVFQPLFPYRTTDIHRAFLINALILGCVSALSIELRLKLDRIKETKGLPRYQKIGITLAGTFCIGFIIYLILRILFGFGEGMVSTEQINKLW